MKRLLIGAMTIMTLGNVCLANTYNENGYSYINIPHGCVVIKEDTKQKVYMDYTPFGALITNQEGQAFYYYDETGINYNLIDGKSSNVGAGMITLIKKKK